MDGAGGRAAATAGGKSRRAGLLTPSEARDLRRAEQAFKRLRIELHLIYQAGARTECCSTCSRAWRRSTASTPRPRGVPAS